MIKPRPSKRKVKRLIAKVHLWLGVLTGTVVFILGITGALYAFENEIKHLIYKDLFYVKRQETKPLPLSILRENAQKKIGDDLFINYINTLKHPDKAWLFTAYKGDKSKPYFNGGVVYYKIVFVNPYTGNVLGVLNMKKNFFNIIVFLHQNLLIGSVGKQIISWSSFIFVFQLILGFILWFPKRKKRAIKQAFTIKRKVPWRRFNFDLHNVLGAYVFSFAIIIGITGCILAFSWLQALVYMAFNLSFENQEEVFNSKIPQNKTQDPIDKIFKITLKEFPNAPRYLIMLNEKPDAPTYGIAYVYDNKYYKHHELTFDKYSGKILDKTRHEDNSLGHNVIHLVYDIHIGTILGFPGKILAFFVALLISSLPLTGVFIWLGRRYKKKKHIQKPIKQEKYNMNHTISS